MKKRGFLLPITTAFLCFVSIIIIIAFMLTEHYHLLINDYQKSIKNQYLAKTVFRAVAKYAEDKPVFNTESWIVSEDKKLCYAYINKKESKFEITISQSPNSEIKSIYYYHVN